MQNNAGFADEHLTMQAFKKKPQPANEQPEKRIPSRAAVIKPASKKIILNDQLSITSKSKTAGPVIESSLLGRLPQLAPSKDVIDHLRNSNISEMSFDQASRKSGSINHLSTSQTNYSKKHGASEAETGARTSQAPSHDMHLELEPGKDWLCESGESLKESLGVNNEIFEYVYSEEKAGCDIESFKKVAKLNKEMDKLIAETLEEKELNEDLTTQIERLEKVKQLMEEREQREIEMASMAERFKKTSREVIDLPEDYEEVVERVVEQVLEERERAEDEGVKDSKPKGSDADDLQDSFIMKAVQDKLMSTLYGFAKRPQTQQSVKQALDNDHQKKIARIRQLDKQLSLKEKEEKAVKEMIRLNKKKERELQLENKLKESQSLEDNSSGVTANSSKSDFFPTQPKRSKPLPSKRLDKRKEGDANSSQLVPGKKLQKLPSRPASQQTGLEENCNLLRHQSADFVKRNIECISLSDHDRFILSLKPEEKVRYDSLIQEIQAGLDSDDPEEFKRVSQLHYENIYGYPPELQEKFKKIDERIVQMLSAEDKADDMTFNTKDILRLRVQEKEAKRRIKQIDQTVEKLNKGELDPSPEELQAALQERIASIDPEIIKSIKATVDLGDFEDWEELDKEAIEIMKEIDFDSMEHYLSECLETLEKTEEHLKKEEEINKIADIEALERSQAFIDNYVEFIQTQKTVLDEFKIHEKLNSEEDFDRFEDEVKAKLRENAENLDKWSEILEQGQGELDQLQIDLQVLLRESAQLKLRDPSKFDEELEAELAIKKPDLFRKNSSSDDECEEKINEENNEIKANMTETSQISTEELAPLSHVV